MNCEKWQCFSVLPQLKFNQSSIKEEKMFYWVFLLIASIFAVFVLILQVIPLYIKACPAGTVLQR